MTSSGT